jgi:hypothetical protein
VSIYLLQSKRGTITNSAGKFSLNTTGNEDILTASYMGYETVQVKITPKADNLQIQLKQGVLELDEVVVNSLSATELLKSAVKKIPDNYEQSPFMFKTYYRAKVSEKDTLLYMEETAFNIIKSYRPGFADKYFLEKNRNFRFVPHRQYLIEIGQYDFVNNASKVFDNAFFLNRDINYLPATTYDNRLVYVLSVSPKNKKDDLGGKIYIDVEDLAFVRLDLGHVRQGRWKCIAQYKKIDGKYYLISGYSFYLNRYSGNIIHPAESNMITTEIIHNFTQEDIKGIPVSAEDNLESYAQQQDTLFWAEHNALLPDTVVQQAMANFRPAKKTETSFDSMKYKSYIKRLYRPSVYLSFSSDWTKDFASLNQNSVSISRTIDYLLINKLGSFKGSVASVLYHFFSTPFEEVLSEQQLLNVHGLTSKINPVIFNKFQSSYVSGLSNDVLTEYKTNYYNDFMRMHTIRQDGHWVKAQIIEDELVQANLSNRNNRRSFWELYWVELFIHKLSMAYSPFAKDRKTLDVSEDKQPIVIDRDKSWVKYLFEPDAEYNRHILNENLTGEEQRYLKRSAWLSWMNVLSPQIFGIKKFRLTNSTAFTFSLNYLRTPFGEMFGQNVYLTNYSRLHGIYLRQYKNHEQTTFGAGYKLFDLKLFKNMYVTSTLDYWKQPSGSQFFSKSFVHGFHIGQMLEYRLSPDKYTRQNKAALLFGYDFKTDGYLPQSYFLGKNFDAKMGVKWYF